MDVEAALGEVGAILIGYHFRYQSKKHGPNYINIDPLLPEALTVWKMGYHLVEPFLGEFDVIACPATGGIPLGYAAAFQAIEHGFQDVKVVFSEKAPKQNDDDPDVLIFERATFADHVRDKRVLVVDDIMTNANELGTVYRLCRLVESHGGTVIGVSLVCNRCQGTASQLDVAQLEQLMEANFVAYVAEECPLCEQEVPIVEDIGHGADQKREHPDYAGGYVSLLS
jgi:orotate phosphoribosyltransferase